MPTLVVLFNLKPGADRESYEQWARSTDLPVVRALPSVQGRFEILRTAGLLGGGSAPYQYVEIIRFESMEQFGSEIAGATVQRVAAEFRAFAEQPLFMLADAL